VCTAYPYICTMHFFFFFWGCNWSCNCNVFTHSLPSVSSWEVSYWYNYREVKLEMAMIQCKESVNSIVTSQFMISVTLRGLRAEVLAWWRTDITLCHWCNFCCSLSLSLSPDHIFSVVHNFTTDFSKQSLQLQVQKHVFVFSSDSMDQNTKIGHT
jgi:hypothetical protein